MNWIQLHCMGTEEWRETKSITSLCSSLGSCWLFLTEGIWAAVQSSFNCGFLPVLCVTKSTLNKTWVLCACSCVAGIKPSLSQYESFTHQFFYQYGWLVLSVTCFCKCIIDHICVQRVTHPLVPFLIYTQSYFQNASLAFHLCSSCFPGSPKAWHWWTRQGSVIASCTDDLSSYCE